MGMLDFLNDKPKKKKRTKAYYVNQAKKIQAKLDIKELKDKIAKAKAKL